MSFSFCLRNWFTKSALNYALPEKNHPHAGVTVFGFPQEAPVVPVCVKAIYYRRRPNRTWQPPACFDDGFLQSQCYPQFKNYTVSARLRQYGLSLW
jgi:hypothetical protein